VKSEVNPDVLAAFDGESIRPATVFQQGIKSDFDAFSKAPRDCRKPRASVVH